jgi:hypothetical protein
MLARNAVLTAVVGAAAAVFIAATAAQAQILCDNQGFAERLPPPPQGCHRERISASGNERPSTFWARRSALDHWQDQILTKFGERFGRWENAACPREECVPAALPGFTRCTLTAYACSTRVFLEDYIGDAYELNRADIREMQRLLNRYGYSLEVDGRFGGRTAEALERGLPTRENLDRLRQGGRRLS